MGNDNTLACSKITSPQPLCPAGTGLELTPGGIVVYINAEGMGRGDERLGQMLMAAYMETLLHFAPRLSHLLLVNSGVKLACKGSPSLAHLLELASMEVEILACGTCLKFYGLSESLRAGSVSNMYTIVEVMSKSDKVLTP